MKNVSVPPDAAPAGQSRRDGQWHGEPYIWLTSVGLTIGLLMIAALLAVIVKNGLAVFWPDRVVQIELAPGSPVSPGGSPILAGEIRRKQAKPGQAAGHGTEWQIYMANREVYDLAFRFVDEEDIRRVTYPPDLAMMERLEYGNALGRFRRLDRAGGTALEAEDPEFERTLEELIAETNARRRVIRRIEKSDIGRINARMEDLRLRRKKIENDRIPDEDRRGRLAEIKRERDILQADYEVLAARARDLRARQSEHRLTYVLADGRIRTVPVGEILHFYHPNGLSFAGRLRLFAVNFWSFLSEDPREANTEGGIFPAIFGTFVMTVLMSVAVTPFGVLAAIYLREYAKQGPFVRTVRIAVNNLAGVPSIVFGVFGLGFFVYFVGGGIDQLFFKDALPTPTFGTGGLLWASLTLALMTVPVVIVSTEEALAAVPQGMRAGSLACGASKWQTIQRIVLPASAPGIMTGFILAMARGAGEVAPLMLVGVVKLAPALPLDGMYPFLHLERKFMHLGFHIYDLGFQSPDSEEAKPMVFATTLVLITLVVVLNMAAILIRERLRRRYVTGAF